MSDIFFSVIIPTYNRLSTLDRAIKSVCKQSFNSYELIVVNDGSSDDTEDYLNDNKITFFNSAQVGHPKGVSFARNLGVSKSLGQWICFLDSDDEWFEDKLDKQYEMIQNNHEVFLVHGEERWIRNGKRVNQMKKHKKGGGDQFIRSLNLCLISPSAVAIRRDIYNEFHGFREDFVVCEDYDLWLKITSKYPVHFISDEIILKYGGHEDQLSRKFKAMDYWRIKSIDWIISHGDLSDEKKKTAREVLLKKSQILLNGYIKHQNLENFEEVKYIYNKYSVGV